MDILSKIESLTTTADNMELAMDLLACKLTNFSELSELVEDVDEIKELEKEIKESITDHKDYLTDDYKVTKELIEVVTEKIFYVLNEVENKEVAHQASKPLQEISSPCPHLLERPGASAAFSEFNTPRMTLKEYAKSPLIKKKASRLNFSDFECEITNEAFEKVPSYIRGRTSLCELQDFLDNSVIKSFNDKYELIYKDRKVLKQSEFSLQSMLRDQSSYFKGQKFITIGDLSRTMNKNIEKKVEKLIQCLRHLLIVKEVRYQTTPCYIWSAK